MKKIIYIIISLIIIIAIWASLAVYTMGNTNENELQNKVSQELLYLNQYFITMLGEFNGLTIGDNRLQETEPKIQTNINTNLTDQTEKNQNDNAQQSSKIETKTDTVQNGILKNNGKYEPEWEKIETQIEQIYQVWNTMCIDLYSLNIEKSLIQGFNNSLNKATQAIKNRNKQTAMDEITSLHEKILQYKKTYYNESNNIDLLSIQANAVSAYSDVSNDRWNQANTKLTSAEKTFSNLLNTVANDYTNQATMSQCYISINELKKAVELQDKEIFFIEYRNLMNKMEIIIK